MLSLFGILIDFTLTSFCGKSNEANVLSVKKRYQGRCSYFLALLLSFSFFFYGNVFNISSRAFSSLWVRAWDSDSEAEQEGNVVVCFSAALQRYTAKCKKPL